MSEDETPAGEGARAGDCRTRTVIMKRGGDEPLLIVELRTWDEGGYCLYHDPGSLSPDGRQEFEDARSAEAWLREFLDEQTHAFGWEIVFDGAPPGDGGDDARSLSLGLVIIGAGARAAVDTGEPEGAARLALFARGDTFGMVRLQRTERGAIIHQAVHLDTHLLTLTPHHFRRRDEAAEEFAGLLGELGSQGWRRFYLGPARLG